MKKIAILSILSLLLTGCLKDLTVTEFDSIELPEVENLEKKYVVANGEQLVIVPEVKYSDMDNLAFEWQIDGQVVSTEKDLNWTCELENNVSGALYITRKSAGNSSVFSFFIELEKPFERGWLLAREKGGKVVYDFVKEKIGDPYYTYTAVEDIVTTESTPESWLGFMEFWANNSTDPVGHILTMDKDLNKCFNTRAEYSVTPCEVKLKDEFIDETFPENVQLSGACYGGFVGYLIGDNGRVYSRLSEQDFFTGRFSNMPMRNDQNEEFQVTSIIGGSYSNAFLMMFEESKGTFSLIKTGWGSTNYDAGKVDKMPNDNVFSNLKGQKIIYSNFLKPEFPWDMYVVLFVISKDASGKYLASEYKIDSGFGDIFGAHVIYQDREIVDFCPEASAVTLNVKSGIANFYYVSQSDPKKLLFVSRESKSFSEPHVYGIFDSEISSIDAGYIGNKDKLIPVGMGMADGSVIVLNLAKHPDAYVAPAGEERNSLYSVLDGSKDKILKIKYKYGKVGQF